MQPNTVVTKVGPIEVADIGSGPAVLLVHGMPGDWSQLAPLARELSDSHRVLSVSRPGYGSTPLATGPTWSTTAAAYEALLDELDIERTAIIGVSGGGPSSHAFANERRQRCSGLVLCCAVHPDVGPVPLALRVLYALPGIREALVALAHRREVRTLQDPDAVLAAAIAAANDTERALIEADPVARTWMLEFADHHARVSSDMRPFAHDLGQIQAHRRRGLPLAWAPGPDVPTHVLHGDADDVVSVANGERYAAGIPGAELTILPGGSHGFLLTFRRQTMPMLRTFLARTAVV